MTEDEGIPSDAVVPSTPAKLPAMPPEPEAAPVVPPAPVNVNVTHSIVIDQRSNGPGFLVRALWFIFIGWWLSWFAIALAYFLCLIIVGLPLGFAIFNRLPTILTLRPRTEMQTTEVIDGVTYVTGGNVPQRPMWVRAVYFIFVGWWLGAFYLALAWFLCVILITLPLGLYLFNRVGAVMTLLRY